MPPIRGQLENFGYSPAQLRFLQTESRKQSVAADSRFPEKRNRILPENDERGKNGNVKELKTFALFTTLSIAICKGN